MFNQNSWPFASSSQALYVRTRSKLPSDNFASECNLSPGEAAKLLKVHFFPGKKMMERFNNAILQENKRKTRFKWWCSKKLCFSMFLLASRLTGWSSRQVSRENRIYSESRTAIQRHSENFWVDSYWFQSSNMPRMQESNDCMSNHVCGDGNTSLKDFPVKSIKGEDAAWTSRPWLESLESCEMRLRDW